MRKDGKSLEKTIQLIEETFKDSETTKIYRNYKLKNVSGDNREIDVLVKINVNGYDMCIAIECKDYRAKVSAEKVEAFNSKCSMIKEINKMIFVSTNGFQSGAISSADHFGIELLTAEEVSKEYLNNLFPVQSLNFLIVKIIAKTTYTALKEDSETIAKINELPIYEFCKGEDKIPVDIDIVINDVIQEHTNLIKNLFLLQWLKLNNDDKTNSILSIFLEISFNEHYIKYDIEKFIQVSKQGFEVQAMVEYTSPEVTGRIIKHSNSVIKAQTLNIKMSDDSESEIVIKNENELDFYLSANNKTIKLEKLFKFNAKTGTLTKQ